MLLAEKEAATKVSLVSSFVRFTWFLYLRRTEFTTTEFTTPAPHHKTNLIQREGEPQ